MEGSKEEEAKEVPTHIDKKKRKDKAQTVSRPKKIIKPSLPKPTKPTTRASAHVILEKAK